MKPPLTCTHCAGHGTDPTDLDDGKGPHYWECPVCHGTGYTPDIPAWNRRGIFDDNYAGPDCQKDLE